MSDELSREEQIRRAREVLDGAGWLFDDFVNNEMRKVLVSAPEDRDGREAAYLRARVATEMKTGLQALVDEAKDDQVAQQYREQMTEKLKGKQDGR